MNFGKLVVFVCLSVSLFKTTGLKCGFDVFSL